MTLRTCGHGNLLGTGCHRCDQMQQAIRGEAGDERPPEPTREEIDMRRGSRWPEYLQPPERR